MLSDVIGVNFDINSLAGALISLSQGVDVGMRKTLDLICSKLFQLSFKISCKAPFAIFALT
jgi:hypothetical protein